jgi:RNA polymerase sigma-70 factor (ECF subfamily)
MTAAGDRRGGDASSAARQIAMATSSGAPGLVLRDADGVLSVISFTVDGGRIAAIDVVRNPDKLTGVREPG